MRPIDHTRPSPYPVGTQAPKSDRTGLAITTLPAVQTQDAFDPALAETRRSWGRVAGIGFVHAVHSVRDVHTAVLNRVYGIYPGAAEPLRGMHVGIVRGIYDAVALTGLTGGILTGEIGARTPPRTNRQPRDPSRPASVTSVRDIVNGLWGDHLASAREALAVEMSVRHEGRSVAPTAGDLSSAFPNASGRIVVFVPGLMASEASWRYRSQIHYSDSGVSFGSRLSRDLGMTSVYVAYNTGLPIPVNGRHLSSLLANLVASWPVPVRELVLVGHSMGGLVVRSACGLPATTATWRNRLTHTVSLGTPHLGAPLEQGIAYLARALEFVPETRPVARVLSSRSVGVRHLRNGTVTDESTPPDDTRTGWSGALAGIPHARHHAIAATRAKDPTTFRARTLGDGTVPLRSAHGIHRDPSQAVAFRPEDLHLLPGLSHTDLLNHPRVYEVLRRILAPGSARSDR